MSSDLQSAVEFLRLNNYVSLFYATLIVYDYVLTFPREVNYVWRRPWTFVSMMFFLVRYVGLSYAMLSGFGGTTFIPGPQSVSTAIYLALNWEYLVFLAATDCMMILRVYSIWNRSKTIGYVLLAIFLVQLVVSGVLAGMYFNSDHISVTISQLSDFSFCDYSPINVPSMLTLYINLPRLLLGVVLLVLAAMQTLKQWARIHDARNQLQPPQYVRLLVKYGIFYFVMNVLINVTDVLTFATINSVLVLFLSSFGYAGSCILMPRFILSVQELYERELGGRCRGIDGGFGLSGRPMPVADVSPGQSRSWEGYAEDSDGIPLSEVRCGSGGNVIRGHSGWDEIIDGNAGDVKKVIREAQGAKLGGV